MKETTGIAGEICSCAHFYNSVAIARPKYLFSQQGRIVHIAFNVSDPDGVIADSVDGPCRSGNFFLSALPKTNLYLLVVENWSEYRQSLFYNFNCHISNRVYDAGAFRIVNGTCAHIETETSLRKKEKCPALKNVQMKCSYNAANSLITGRVFQWAIGTIIIALSLT